MTTTGGYSVGEFTVRIEWVRTVEAETAGAARELVLDEPLDTHYVSDVTVEGEDG